MENVKLKIQNSMIFLLFTFYFLLTPSSAHAEIRIGEWYPFGDLTSLGEGVSRLVMPAFSVGTVGVTFYFIFGAFKYITSAGNKEEVAKAQGMMTHAIIGFILLMFSFLIFQFIISSLFGSTNIQFVGS